jgi:hypothetical protein
MDRLWANSHEGWIASMAKVSTYRLDNYDLPPGSINPPGGLFQLSDAEWHLLSRDPGGGVSCGLRRSQVEVEELGRRRCQVTVSDDRDGGFHATFVLRARAQAVRDDLAVRLASLDRSGEVIAAVERGQWWQDVRVFDRLGWSRTRSIAGVRCNGGRWGAIRAKRTRLARVLDFGPNGVSLRGWRTRLAIPWDGIAAIEVTDGRHSAARGSQDGKGTGILLRSHSDEELAFYTVVSNQTEIGTQLSSLLEHLDGASLTEADDSWTSPVASDR